MNSQIIQDKIQVTNKQPIIIMIMMMTANKILVKCQVFTWSGKDQRVVTVRIVGEVVVK